MSLPKGIRLDQCVADPGNRMNHIYHAKTDQVFHVAPELAQKVYARVSADSQSADDTDVLKTGDETRDEDLTDRENLANAEDTEEASDEGEESFDRAELLAMAEALELTVPEGITDADLSALVETAIASDKETQE